AAIEPSLAGVRVVFPAGIELIWCLVSLPPDVTEGHLALEFKAIADDRPVSVRNSGSIATWQGRSDGLYCAGAGHGGGWPAGRYRCRALVGDRLIGETFCTVGTA